MKIIGRRLFFTFPKSHTLDGFPFCNVFGSEGPISSYRGQGREPLATGPTTRWFHSKLGYARLKQCLTQVTLILIISQQPVPILWRACSVLEACNVPPLFSTQFLKTHWFSGLTCKWLLYGSDLHVRLTRRKKYEVDHIAKWNGRSFFFLWKSTKWTFLTLFSGTQHPAGVIGHLADRRAKTARWNHRAEDGRFGLQVKEEITLVLIKPAHFLTAGAIHNEVVSK